MSTSVLVEGHSISGTATLPRNDSYPVAKLPYAKTNACDIHIPVLLPTAAGIAIVMWEY